MGGRAFAKGHPALYVPRLSPPVYRHVYSHVSKTLASLFPRVASPIEGPQKTYYGDLDMMVSLEGSAFTQQQRTDPQRTMIWDAVHKAFAPTRSISERKRVFDVRSLAIPWPSDLSPDQMKAQLAVETEQLVEEQSRARSDDHLKKAQEKAETLEKVSQSAKATVEQQADAVPQSAAPEEDIVRHIHLEIRLCDTDEDLDWHLFKASHGYFWPIIGSSMRPLGLLVDNKGLQLSIHDHNILAPRRRSSRMFLTKSPTRALDFLRLSHTSGEWERPFPSIEALARYIKTYRWYRHRPAIIAPCNPLIKSDAEYMPKLNTLTEAIYHNRSLGEIFNDPPPENLVEKHRLLEEDRADVRRAVFEEFSGTEQTYVDQTSTFALQHRIKIWRNDVRNIVKAYVPPTIDPSLLPPYAAKNMPAIQKMWRDVLIAGLRGLLLNESASGYKLESVEPPKFDHTTPSRHVKAWIRDNWENVGREAWARVEPTVLKTLATKRALRSAEEGEGEERGPDSAAADSGVEGLEGREEQGMSDIEADAVKEDERPVTIVNSIEVAAQDEEGKADTNAAAAAAVSPRSEHQP